MPVKDEKRMATTDMRMVRWAMGVSLLEHRRNEEILEEAKMEAIATVMRRRRLEWFRHVKRRGETENIRAVAEMKMEGKRPRGRPKLRWNDTVRRDLKAWNIKRNGPLTEKDGKVSARPASLNRETAAKGEKVRRLLTLSYSSIWKQNVPREIPFFIRSQYPAIARKRSNTTAIIVRVKI